MTCNCPESGTSGSCPFHDSSTVQPEPAWECGRIELGGYSCGRPMGHKGLHRRRTPPEALLRALWECGVASGMDTDGDAGPEAMIAGMGEAAFASAMVEQVRQLRRDYDEANATDKVE